jgi:acetylornithine deacetylase
MRDAALAILDDLVAFPTVTADSNLDLIAYAAEQLDGIAADVVLTHDDTGTRANLFATIGPVIDGGVVLSGHTDVVPADPAGWRSDPFVATQRDGAVFGRGTADMKGFIACVLAVAPELATAGLRRPVHIALTFDEEVGFRGAPVLLAELTRTGPTPSAAIVGEPTGLGIVAAHKGCYEYTTTFAGVEGHGSLPDRGVNAVEHAARFVARLVELRAELAERAPADSRFDPPASTINVGTIRGGTARNTVAGSCTVEWELRPVQAGDADHVRATVAAFARDLVGEARWVGPDAVMTTDAVCEIDGLELAPDSAALRLGRELLDEPEERVVAFGTEAGLYQAAGIPAIVCGPGSIDVAHQPDEHIAVADLDACLAMLGRLGGRLSA